MSPSDRRDFLKRLGLTGAGALGLSGCAAPSDPPPDGNAVSVTGRVTAPDGGVANVPVTDGITVTTTDGDGHFHFTASARQPFVHLSVPAGYRLPTNENGLRRGYRPLDAGSGDSMTVSFDLTRLDRDDTHHAFVFLADPQARTEAEMEEFRRTTIPDVTDTVQALGDRPVFGVGGGDLVFDTLSLFSEYETAVQDTRLPFVQVVGNHDLNVDASGDPGSTATFRTHFGPTYYSFDRGAVHYVVLDDVYWPGSDGFGEATDSYLGHLDTAQLHWLRQDLALVEDGRPVIVLAHIPPLSTMYERRDEPRPSPRNMIVNREALHDLLAPFDAHIVTGHIHENEHRFADGPHEHVVGTACGAWWTGPICYDGTPRGYVVYEVDGASVQWRYKSTGREADHQMRLTVPDGDRLVANVWDADDAWTITWFEEGLRKGELTQTRGLAPRARTLYAGEEQPEKYDWVEPQPTDHLFTAPYNPKANRIRVEATDRFGRTYTASLGTASNPS
ncbi:MAG: hypothetical protein BRD55_01165 [Bacteroidetes bacterium SW_9_63_38]|nr:MAG: hypothetical protein BRD55_01165 [Bacteroidetes bacterium SW_9_63_38]